jgi:hypothetical protein
MMSVLLITAALAGLAAGIAAVRSWMAKEEIE